MNEPNDSGREGPSLPPDLEELHRSLSNIRLEERASFGPELEAELERAWVRRRPLPRPRSPVRPWMVAAAGLATLTLSVPPARAALARILEVVHDPGPAVESVEATPPSGAAGGEGADDDVLESSGSREPALRMDVPSLALGPPAAGDGEEGTRNLLPHLSDRRRAEDLIRDAYPEHLQRAGIGGTVRILLYVEPTGNPNHIRVRRGSGVDELDRAAVEAAGRFDFNPAVHDGARIGQWVEFDVRFRVPRRDPSLSDLHLVPSRTDPAEAAELRLLDPREVRGVRGRPGRGELGVFFQLHDLPEGSHEYELRATLEPEGGGERIRLRLHPQDEGPYRPTWRRSATGPGSSAEYVLLDFGRVEAGEYVLRLEAVLVGSERIVESARRLRVR